MVRYGTFMYFPSMGVSQMVMENPITKTDDPVGGSPQQPIPVQRTIGWPGLRDGRPDKIAADHGIGIPPKKRERNAVGPWTPTVFYEVSIVRYHVYATMQQ